MENSHLPKIVFYGSVHCSHHRDWPPKRRKDSFSTLNLPQLLDLTENICLYRRQINNIVNEEAPNNLQGWMGLKSVISGHFVFSADLILGFYSC